MHSCDKHTSGHWETACERAPFISNAGNCCGDAPRAGETILEDMTIFTSETTSSHRKKEKTSESSVTDTSQYIMPDTDNSHSPHPMLYAPSCNYREIYACTLIFLVLSTNASCTNLAPIQAQNLNISNESDAQQQGNKRTKAMYS